MEHAGTLLRCRSIFLYERANIPRRLSVSLRSQSKGGRSISQHGRTDVQCWRLQHPESHHIANTDFCNGGSTADSESRRAGPSSRRADARGGKAPSPPRRATDLIILLLSLTNPAASLHRVSAPERTLLSVMQALIFTCSALPNKLNCRLKVSFRNRCFRICIAFSILCLCG